MTRSETNQKNKPKKTQTNKRWVWYYNDSIHGKVKTQADAKRKLERYTGIRLLDCFIRQSCDCATMYYYPSLLALLDDLHEEYAWHITDSKK